MKNKIDKYLELAKEVHLANVPLDKPEAESLLGKSGRGTAQNFVKRFINFFGRHLFMTITSIIAVILIGIYLLSPFGMNGFQNGNKTNEIFINQPKQIEIKEIIKPKSEVLIAKNTSYIQNSNKTENQSKLDTISQIIILSSKVFNIDDIRWNEIEFLPEEWDFRWIYKSEKAKIFDEYGKSQIQNLNWSKQVEEKDLIRFANQLEDSIQKFVNISQIKSICLGDLSDYFNKLSNIVQQLNDSKYHPNEIKMLNLFAQINRKLLNNPGQTFKIKSKGIHLPKDALIKLGFKFTDSSFSIPFDQIIKNNEQRNSYFNKNYLFKKIRIIEIPNVDVTLKQNYIYEWEKTSDSLKNNEIYWQGAKFNLWEREKFSYFKNFFKGIILDTAKSSTKAKTVNSQSYYEINDIQDVNHYNPLSPVLFENRRATGIFDAVLFWGNPEMKEFYETNVKISSINYKKLKLKEKWDMDSIEYQQLVDDSTNTEIIFNNLQFNLKFRYLIPVDIQIPYYGFTKEQLDTMPNATFVTLWYYPNEEFLSALPVEIRKQLEKEMKLVELVQKGEIQPEVACEEVKESKSLLGLCNLTNSAITNLNLFPNPALDYLNIKFDVLDNRIYKIILSDAAGQYVKDLSDWTESGKNEIKMLIPTTELQNGTYIIQIITEKSEKLMSKFVVKK